MFKALLFDHDGVILDSEPLHRKVWRQFLGKQGITLSAAELDQHTRGRKSEEIIKQFIPEAQDHEILQNLYQERKKLYAQLRKDKFTLVPGVKDFIIKASQKYQLAVVSSAEKQDILYTLRRAGLEPCFQTITSVEEISKGKPDPEIYLLTAKKLDLSPSECLVFEDSLAGIAASNNANMKAVAILTNQKKEDFQNYKVTHFIEDFTQIDTKAIGTL